MIRPREDLPAPAAPAAPPAGALLDSLPPDLEYFRSSEAYRVDLAAFQGPLDLLLYLIQKDEVDVYDIPIGQITQQYLKYLEVIQALDLDTAGDFLVMAATLMRIKARLLLPVQPAEALDEEDPRAELVRRLLEYKRFKEAAAALRGHEEERSRWHVRQARWPFLDEQELPPPQLRFNMYELLSALSEVLDKLQAPTVHTVQREPFTVDEKMERIRERLQAGPLVRFDELFAGDAIKMEVVVTFIALLEMCKRGEAAFVQTEFLGPIWIRPAAPALKAAAAAAGEAGAAS
ncbi:MAG: segregation and condensation protein A [Candidatus Krumholzibacteriia bacterium]